MKHLLCAGTILGFGVTIVKVADTDFSQGLCSSQWHARLVHFEVNIIWQSLSKTKKKQTKKKPNLHNYEYNIRCKSEELFRIRKELSATVWVLEIQAPFFWDILRQITRRAYMLRLLITACPPPSPWTPHSFQKLPALTGAPGKREALKLKLHWLHGKFVSNSLNKTDNTHWCHNVFSDSAKLV